MCISYLPCWVVAYLMTSCLNAVPRQKYCESIHKTVRRKTRTVMVGNVALGSEHPIRIQTMTTTDTKDVAATVEQVFCLFPIILLPFLDFKELYSIVAMSAGDAHLVFMRII